MVNLVTVVIPFYNNHKTIKRAIDSVLNQTYDNIEIIIVDDCSTNSLNLDNDDRYRCIKIITHKQNKGLSSARNTGVRSALGEYIAFLDADDEYHPDKIHEQILAIRENSVVTCESLRIYPNNFKKKLKTKYNYVSKIHQIIFKNHLNGAALLIKRSTLQKLNLYDEKLRSCEDYDLYLRLLRNNYKIIIINKPLYLYYFSKNSLTRDFDQISKYELEVLYKNKDYCKNFLEDGLFELAISGYIFRQFVRAHLSNDLNLLSKAREKSKELNHVYIKKILQFMIKIKLHILISWKIKKNNYH